MILPVRPFALILLLLPATAFAGDKKPDVRRKVDQGTALFEKGDFAGATEVFADVYKTTGETKYLWNLALAEHEAGRFLDALAHLKEYATKPDASPKNVTRARDLVMETEGHLLRATVVVPDGATLSVDGMVLGTGPISDPIDLEPDKPHVIEAHRGSDVARQEIAPTTPQALRVELSFPPPPPSPPVAPLPPPPETSSVDAHRTSPARVWLTVGLGVVAVGGVGLGALLGANSNTEYANAQDARAKLGTSTCYDNPNAASCVKLRNDVSAQGTDHTLSMVFYTGAGVCAAGAVASWFLLGPRTHETERQAHIVPYVGPQGAGASIVEEF